MSARRAIVAPPVLAVEAGAVIVLADDVSHYVRGVLRLRTGDPIELYDGAGGIARGVVDERRGDKSIRVTVDAVERAPAPAGPEIALFQAIGKNDKVDSVLRAATELGARRLVPVRTARAVADRSGRLDRWQSIVDDAVRVSGRAWAPVLEPIRSLDEVLARPRAPLAIALDGAGSSPLGAALAGAQVAAVDVLVGPEGGFAEEERAAIDAAGWSRVTLGAHTLRTETAGPAIVAILGFVLGGLG